MPANCLRTTSRCLRCRSSSPLPGSSPAAAVAAFENTVNRALSCVMSQPTKTPTRDYRDLDRIHALTTGVNPVWLSTARGGSLRTGLLVSMQYKVIEVPDRPRRDRFKVRTVQYMHHVYG